MTYRKVTTLQLRVVETIEFDDDDDTRPSISAPAASVDTTGEPVNDWKPLVKCKAPTRVRKVG